VQAIKSYLFTLLPVNNVPPQNTLKFPYNQRWLMSFWSLLFNPDERFRPTPERSAEWNRGAYLVEALAHCGDCHTPRNLLQALDNKRKFSGAVSDGWRAYNITADRTSGVGAWNETELAQYLSTGHAAGRGTASGPMAQAVELSFARLTPGDIRAMVTYVRSVPALATPDLPAPKAELAFADPRQGVAANADPHGMQTFAGACVSCHGWTGVSLLAPHATLTGNRAVNDPTATNVVQMILWGSKRPIYDGTLNMPGFATIYNDDTVAALSNYVTARFGAMPSSITAEDVRKLRETQE
jgi:mono/diheme cytochrome c family protein